MASTVSTKCPSSSGTAFSHVAREPPGPQSVPGDSAFPPEHGQVSNWGVAAFGLPLFTVLKEFKPSPFSFLFLLSPFSLFSLVPAAVSNFPLSPQLHLGKGAFSLCFPPPQSLSYLCRQNGFPPFHGFFLPKFSSSCCIPAEFCGSGCADCCVNLPISFLGV